MLKWRPSRGTCALCNPEILFTKIIHMSRIRGVVANYLASQVRDPEINSHQHLKDSWHIWRHLRRDTVFSCNLRFRLIFLHGCSRTHCVASLRAVPVGRISYNLYFDCKHVRSVTCDLINEYTFFTLSEGIEGIEVWSVGELRGFFIRCQLGPGAEICTPPLYTWSVLVAQLVERPAGLTYVFAKGVFDQVRDPLTPRNSLQ